jgi:hypothetical protein
MPMIIFADPTEDHRPPAEAGIFLLPLFDKVSGELWVVETDREQRALSTMLRRI